MPTRRQFLLALAVGAHALPVLAQTRARLIHRVEITDFAFDPPQIEVRIGDIVEWTNRDLVPHTATANNQGWDTGSLESGATGRIVMKTPGTFAYRCTFHPHMKGVVHVLK